MTNNKPSSHEEIHAAATVMFMDKSITSVIVEASFGNIEILRRELDGWSGYEDYGSED